jgi:enoyl-CoA hydratase/carnithine racemase
MRIERDGAVAVLHMESGKANAMSAQFLDALSGMFNDLGDAKAAVIVGNEKIFSAGLDLPSIIDLPRKPLTAFMARFEAVMLQAFELPIPLVAAISGHAIAGGAVLALQADVRIAVDREALRIGFNEAQLGMGLPSMVIEPLREQVPGPSLTPLVLTGELFGPHQALKLGFLHEVAPEGELLQRAVQKARAFAALPSGGVRNIKSALRKPIADRIRGMSGVANDRFADIWFAPDTQLALRATVAKLKPKG